VQYHAAVPALATLVVAVALIFAVPADSATSSQRRRKQVAPKKAAPTWPSFEARRDDFLRRVRGASAAGHAAPDPLSQFLVSEVIVTGIYETEEGFGAFLHALPNGRTFESRPGSPLYNGRLANILVGASGFMDEGSVVFLERSFESPAEREVSKRIERAPERPAAATPAQPPTR
jgi:hypothetical protein